MDLLSSNQRVTLCEWKGQASYFDLKIGDKIIANVAWTYTNPTPAFEKIKGYLSSDNPLFFQMQGLGLYKSRRHLR